MSLRGHREASRRGNTLETQHIFICACTQRLAAGRLTLMKEGLQYIRRNIVWTRDPAKDGVVPDGRRRGFYFPKRDGALLFGIRGVR